MLLILLSLLCLTYAQTNTNHLRVVTPDLKVSSLDAITGVISCTVQLPLPDPDTGCHWTLPLVGTMGQTSAIFYMNQTMFITGQEVCASGIKKSVIFGMMGPMCFNGTGHVSIYTLYHIDPTIALIDINMGWDHACNVVVLQPVYLANGTLITTKQVSEYDNQIRPQADYEWSPLPCDTFCWQKVSGLSGLDFGSWNTIWDPELNCGDTCIFYTLEEKVINSKPVLPRRFIGRSFRTHALSLNITDSVQALTLSWNPFLMRGYNQFLGIGICCTHDWCHPDCKQLDSHMVMFSFEPYAGNQFRILADIGDAFDPDTARIGIAFNPEHAFEAPKQVFVMYQQNVITFDYQLDNNGMVSMVKKVAQSSKVMTEVVAWYSLPDPFFLKKVIDNLE